MTDRWGGGGRGRGREKEFQRERETGTVMERQRFVTWRKMEESC